MPFALLPQSDADAACPVVVDEDDAGLLKGALNLPDVLCEAQIWAGYCWRSISLWRGRGLPIRGHPGKVTVDGHCAVDEGGFVAADRGADVRFDPQ